MSNSEFEKYVQHELDDISFEPSDAVWSKVEESLPAKDRRRWLLLLIPLLLAGGIFFITNYASTNTQAPVGYELSTTDKLSTTSKSSGQSDPQLTPIAGVSVPLSSIEEKVDSALVYANETKIGKHINRNKHDNTQNVRSLPAKTQLSKNNQLTFTEPLRFKTKILAAKPEDDETDSLPSLLAATQSRAETSDTGLKNADTLSLTDVSNPKTEPSTLNKLPDTIAKKIIKESKENTRKWVVGLTFGAGLSTMKSGFFSDNKSNAEAIFPNSPTSIPSPPAVSVENPKAPSASFAFTAGMTLEKIMNSKITFHTGLAYLYFSTRTAVGSRVDSSRNFITNAGAAFVDMYYRSGSTDKYLNKFHFITLPLSIQFKPAAQLPLYAEAGLTTSFLVHSNALQYSSGSNAFFRNDNIYNRVNLSMQAGIGVQLTSLKLGYRFNHSLSSLSKDASAQYPVSSIIYVQLPLKKTFKSMPR